MTPLAPENLTRQGGRRSGPGVIFEPLEHRRLLSATLFDFLAAETGSDRDDASRTRLEIVNRVGADRTFAAAYRQLNGIDARLRQAVGDAGTIDPSAAAFQRLLELQQVAVGAGQTGDGTVVVDTGGSSSGDPDNTNGNGASDQSGGVVPDAPVAGEPDTGDPTPTDPSPGQPDPSPGQPDPAGVPPAAPPPPAPPPTPPPPAPPAAPTPGPEPVDAFQQALQALQERLMIAFNGHFESNNDGRRLPEMVLEQGWQAYVDQNIQPMVDYGFRRIMFHNPFGTLAGLSYEYDQYLEALHSDDPRLQAAAQNFVEPWRNIVDQGVEVIFYIGTVLGDSASFGMGDDPYSAEGFDVERMRASVEPLLEAGVSIGFDAITRFAADHPLHQYALELQDRGVTVYVEGRPMVGFEHWADFRIINTQVWWNQSDPDQRQNGWAYTNEQVDNQTPENLLWQHIPTSGNDWNDTGWIGDVIRSTLSDGRTSIVSGLLMSREAGSLEEFLMANHTIQGVVVTP
jgi:hypothetical protein